MEAFKGGEVKYMYVWNKVEQVKIIGNDQFALDLSISAQTLYEVCILHLMMMFLIHFLELRKHLSWFDFVGRSW